MYVSTALLFVHRVRNLRAPKYLRDNCYAKFSAYGHDSLLDVARKQGPFQLHVANRVDGVSLQPHTPTAVEECVVHKRMHNR